MNESVCLPVAVGNGGSFVGGVGEPVVPDAGGEGEESGGDAGVDACDGASAVVFECDEKRAPPKRDLFSFVAGAGLEPATPRL